MSVPHIEKTKPIENELFPVQAQALIAENHGRNDFKLIDVSTPGEFSQRRLDRSINISFFSPSFKSHLRRLDPNHTYLVYCKLGCRSKMACNIMKRNGFNRVYNLKGGTLLWEDEGLPLLGNGKKTLLRLCPVSVLVKGIRNAKKSLGFNQQTNHCEEQDANCQCDGGNMGRRKIHDKWMDCCR